MGRRGEQRDDVYSFDSFSTRLPRKQTMHTLLAFQSTLGFELSRPPPSAQLELLVNKRFAAAYAQRDSQCAKRKRSLSLSLSIDAQPPSHL